MKAFRRIGVFAAAAVMAVSAMGLAACGGNDADNYFEWWLPEGEDAIFYSGYNDNPVVQYLMQQEYAGRTIDVDFVVPPAGEADSNINTAISTGEYQDIIDTSSITKTYSVAELYEEGIALDLTEYVEQYMPNYLAYLDAHPSLKQTAVNLVDGEPRYLQIWAYQNAVHMWGGWNYRRDWIVEYGKDASGNSFTGGYNADGVWTDNIVFPSWTDTTPVTIDGEQTTKKDWYLANIDSTWDGSDPVFISDWEWMLQIFEDAISAEGITDGYVMQLYYPGYLETGDLVTSFGGGGATWYTDENGTVQFGLASDGFRTYLQCMNGWWDNGWIDRNYTDKANQMFYEIDSDKVYQGKVGLWWGMTSNLNDLMRSDADELTENINVWGARQPINDTYGDADVQYKTPRVMYQTTQEMRSIIVTDKAEDKDLELLFTFLDYQYTDECAMMNMFGLTAEQYAQVDCDILEEYNLEETGSYIEYNIDGETLYGAPNKDDDGNAINFPTNAIDAMRGSRLIGLQCNSLKYFPDPEVTLHSQDEYVVFESVGTLANSVIGQLSVEDSQMYAELRGNIRTFGAQYAPQFIDGTQLDPFNDQHWQNYLTALERINRNYTYRDVCDALNEVLAALS